MKKIFLFILILLSISFLSCHKDNENIAEKNGIITGADMRKCMCCGGYFIEIEDSTYRFDSIPANSGINLSIDTFPIYVEVVFHKKNPLCIGDEIMIDKMRKK